MSDEMELFVVAVMEYLENQKLEPDGEALYLQAEKLLEDIQVFPNI